MAAILDFCRNYFSLFFLSASHPDTSYQVSSQLAFRFRKRKSKYIFITAAIGAILDFRSERFYLFFLSASHPDIFIKFRVNWPFGSGEVENRFQDSRKSDQNDFSYFWSASHPDTSYQVSKKKLKTDFQDDHTGSHLGFPIGMIFAISFSLSTSCADSSNEVSSQLAFRFRRRSSK